MILTNNFQALTQAEALHTIVGFQLEKHFCPYIKLYNLKEMQSIILIVIVWPGKTGTHLIIRPMTVKFNMSYTLIER